MIRWNKYIQYGEFKSSSGLTLEFKWVFDSLDFHDSLDTKIITTAIKALAYPYLLVGIESVHPKTLVCDYIYDPKTKSFKHDKIPQGDYVIYDDVVTKGVTVDGCQRVVGFEAEKVICIINRKVEKITILNIVSIQEILDDK